MSFMIQRNVTDELIDGQPSLHRGDKTSAGSCNETMSLLGLLQEMPRGISHDERTIGNPTANPPKKPNRQLTIQDLNDILDMIDEDDDISCDGDVSTLTFSTPGTLQRLDHPLWAPKCPSRQESFQNGCWLDGQDQEDEEDDGEFNFACLRSHGLVEPETPDDEAVPARRVSSASSPPKLPLRSVDDDEMNDFAAALDDDNEDNIIEPDANAVESQDAATVRRNSMRGPPRLPARHSSGNLKRANTDDSLFQCALPILKRGVSLPIDFDIAASDLCDESYDESDTKVRASSPPRCPRRKHSIDASYCL